MAAGGQVEGGCFEVYKVLVFALQYFGYDVGQIIHQRAVDCILQSVSLTYPFNSASSNPNKRNLSTI